MVENHHFVDVKNREREGERLRQTTYKSHRDLQPCLVLKLGFINALVKYLCGFKLVSTAVSIKQTSLLLMKYRAALSRRLKHLSGT